VPPSAHQDYTQCVLGLYRCTPGASGFARRADRQLAARLFDRRVPLHIVQAALLLAVARRSFRPDDAPPLPPIATLHYFLPIIDELMATPPDPDYLDYLRQSLASIAPVFVQKVAALGAVHQFP
jgi:hypothetical protein